MNLYDILLARCICSNKTEYETLDVTENGTYDAPQGKAYDKVNVNVSGGGGGETITWLIEDVAVEVEYNDYYGVEGALFDFSDVLDEATFVSTFSGKTLVSVFNGVKVEAPGYVYHDDEYPEVDQVTIFLGFDDGGSTITTLLTKSDMSVLIEFGTVGETITWSLGIVEE